MMDIRDEFDWWLVPLILSVVIIGLRYILAISGPNRLGRDSALYLLSGLLLSKGKPTYLHLWDIKPPAIHEITALLAIVSGRDRRIMYLLAIGLTALAALGLIIVVMAIAHQLTGSVHATVVGGLSLFAYPPFLYLFTIGIYTKYFAAVFGLLGVYIYLRDRPILGVATAALAASFWQFGVIFFLVVGAALFRDIINQERSPIVAVYSLCAVIVVTLLIIAPFVYLGAGIQMVSQTVIAPVVTGTLLTHPLNVIIWLGPMFVLMGGAAIVILQFRVREEGLRKWMTTDTGLFVAVPAIWFSILGFATGQVGRPDLVPLIGVAGIAIAISYNELDQSGLSTYHYLGVAAVVGALILIGAIHGLLFDWQLNGGEIVQMYWSGDLPSQCHVRLSGPEEEWMALVDEDGNTKSCDQTVLFGK